MQKFQGTVTDTNGTPIASARLTVYTENVISPLPIIYTINSDSTIIVKQNPLLTDSNGDYVFAVAAGQYSIEATGNSAILNVNNTVTQFDPSTPAAPTSTSDITTDLNGFIMGNGSGLVAATQNVDFLSNCFYVQTARNTVSTIATSFNDLVTLPATAFSVGTTIRLTWGGYYSTGAGTSNLIRLRVGTIVSTIPPSMLAGQTNTPYLLQMLLTCTDSGATGHVNCMLLSSVDAPQKILVDTTLTNVISLETPVINSTTFSMKIDMFTLEVLRP
jgi:hypothetical protein